MLCQSKKKDQSPKLFAANILSTQLVLTLVSMAPSTQISTACLVAFIGQIRGEE